MSKSKFRLVESPATNERRAAVIYLRVSTKEQAEKGGEEEGYSIPAQRDACRRKASALNAEVLDEFVDAGESARSADRRDLQRLLTYVAEHHVDFVIVHKIDRLARNRADDVTINLEFQRVGAQLVSCTENIDQTPSGKLLHGIMASISEFYSSNLATEAMKGMQEKAARGGTIGKAPIGYRNVGKIVDGREVRTVEIDESRQPLVQWTFETYATGEWSVKRLLEEVTARGLTAVGTRVRRDKPLTPSRLHGMLRNRYYIGKVCFNGVEYDGIHPQFVSTETFQAVQAVLDGHRQGEKAREHLHYLRSTLACGNCGSRLCVQRTLNRYGKVYLYYFCVGRQQKRVECELPYVSVTKVEALVEKEWAKTRLDPEYGKQLQEVIKSELEESEAKNAATERQLKRQLEIKQGQRRKLLDAYLAEAVGIEVLKAKQESLTKAIEDLERRLAETHIKAAEFELVLGRSLEFLYHPQEAYMAASPKLRRLYNQAIWDRIEVHAEPEREFRVAGFTREPFTTILDPGLLTLRPAVGQEDLTGTWDDGKASWYSRELRRPGRRDLVLRRRGSKETDLAPPTGFEPVLPP